MLVLVLMLTFSRLRDISNNVFWVIGEILK